MFEFSQRELGAGTRQEKNKSLIAKYLEMSASVENLGKEMIRKYLEISFNELQDRKLVIQRIQQDQGLLTSILKKEKINELFQECATTTK